MASRREIAETAVAAFSRSVRARRLAAKLTQVELAERAFVREAFISRIERGLTNPTLVSMALLAAALGCDLADLCREP